MFILPMPQPKLLDTIKKIEEVGIELLYDIVVRDKAVKDVKTLCVILNTVEEIKDAQSANR